VSAAAPPERDGAALERAAAIGIHRLSIPTPFPVGRVNAYLIEDEPLTLIDSGPNSAKALDELEAALDEHGRRVEELGLLVVTHQHADHVGLAAVLARRSGAEVAALEGLGSYLGDLRREGESDDRFGARMMRENGVPADLVTALCTISATIRAWSSSVGVSCRLADGEELTLAGRTLRALHRPGHSPSDTVFVDEGQGMMIAGDHLIAHVSSNPLLARPLTVRGDYEGARPQALISYLESMRRTREMPLELVLPGHGDPISDHRELIDSRLRLHERRAERIHGLLAERPCNAHEVARMLWGDLALVQAYLTLSEVLGHIDLLIAEGRASEETVNGVTFFRAS
jgi:glyoxylase-like metal-dependent hydrolase (beta-lactamase superfamily II)